MLVLTMRLLFAITICCFGAVLWVALSLTRRIRLTPGKRTRTSHRARRWFTQEFFEAGEFRTPRALPLRQEVSQVRPRRALRSETATRGDLRNIEPTHNLQEQTLGPPPVVIRSMRAHPGQPKAAQTEEPVTAKKGTVIPFTGPNSGLSSSRIFKPGANPPSQSTFLGRKLPQLSRPAGVRRVDLSQYSRYSDHGSAQNTHMGDLSDPYTHPLRGSGTQGPVLKRL